VFGYLSHYIDVTCYLRYFKNCKGNNDILTCFIAVCNRGLFFWTPRSFWGWSKNILKEENLEAGHKHGTETNDAPSQILSNNLNLCVFSSLGPRKQASGNAALRWKGGTKGENINTNYKRKYCKMRCLLSWKKTILNEPVAFSVTVLAAVVLFIFSFPWTIETPIKLRLTVTRWGIEEFCNPHSPLRLRSKWHTF